MTYWGYFRLFTMFSDIIARQSTLHNRLYLENRIYFKNERSRVRNPHSWGARRDEGVYSFLSLFQGFSSVCREGEECPYHVCPMCCRCSVRTLPCDLLFWQVGTSPYVVPRASSWCPYPVLSPLLTLSPFSTERVTLERCEHLGGHAFTQGVILQ